jgi:hypothetical protein
MTGRRRTAARLVAGLGACLLAAGCASIPSSSPPQIISETPPRATEPAAEGDIRYDGIAPRPGEQPEDIVRDFLRVAGSYERDHARARAYLTQRGSRTWKADIRTVVLEDPPYLLVQDGGSIVQMSAQQRGRVEADGSYIAARAPYPYTFRLAKVNGEWRIENPPEGLLIEANTFAAAFRSYNVYFLDSTRTKVVPDPRWFAAPREALPSRLVTAIEQGPSQWLAGAVRSDLEDATLQINVVQEGGRVKVYLSGRGVGSADTLSDGAFAQLVWTLNQLGVGGVEVYIDGREVRPVRAPNRFEQRLSDWRGFDPEGLPASTPALFIRNGAVWTTADAPLPGPAGRPGYNATTVAQSTTGSLAVVRRASQGGFTLFVGTSSALRPTVSGETLTPPTWASADDEVWTVRNGREVVLVPATGATRRVSAALDKLGPVRSLRLSRDGSRVAVVAGSRGQEQLHLGVVIRDNSGSVRIERLQLLDVGEAGVADVSWLDALTLVVLVQDGLQDNALHTVSVDRANTSRLVGRSQLPGPPVAVAAASTLPLLTVAAGTLWRTLAIDDSWSPVDGRTDAASAPAYPG